MFTLSFILKIVLVIIFSLYFTVIGINKKTIDSLDNKDELKRNLNTLRGILWSKYAILSLSLIVTSIYIVKKKYYEEYKWTIIFTIFFILLNTGMTVFEEFIVRNIENVDTEKLNNIYIISTIMSVVYFILLVRLINIVDNISVDEFGNLQIARYLRNYPYEQYLDNENYEYEDSMYRTPDEYNENYREITSDNIMNDVNGFYIINNSPVSRSRQSRIRNVSF
jgi:hypothetical protein